MALHICKECLSSSERNLPVTATAGPFRGSAMGHVQSRIRRFAMLLGGVLGGLLGLLLGSPVIVLLGATSGSYLGSMTQAGVGSEGSTEIGAEACEACGEISELEMCPVCERSVCSSCRELIMAEDERDGKRIYRHYEKEQEADEEASHSMAPWNISDVTAETTPSGYRLSDEAYSLNEETGELISVPESNDQNISSNPTPTDEWDFDTVSVSPASDDWEGSEAWSSADWEVDNWDADPADSEGG